MLNVVSPTCIYENCKIQPIFNYRNEKKALYCNEHKLKDMIDIKNPTCKTHLCDLRVSNSNYKGYCLRCFIHTFPDEKVARNYKTKENEVASIIKEYFNDKDWALDKAVEGGCSRRRPDIRVDLGTHNIIIEVDENQHEEYDCSCENKRIMEIFQDLGGRNLVFIRFNPDDYIDINNKKITSCWGNNKKGICVIKKSKLKEWNDRIESLKTQVDYWITNVQEKEVEIIQLYYDIK
jgi:hypothetical protein